MPTALSRILFCLIFILIVLPKTALATENYPTASPEYTSSAVLNILSSIACLIIGSNPIPNQQCLAYDSNGKLTSYLEVPGGGALGGVQNIITLMYQSPPTSTSEYLADLGQQLSIVEPSYAQAVAGAGDGVIKPVLKLWQVMRNLAYLAFIIIFVVVGLMIMFRQKLNPQTTITAQAALPGLIVGLVLVTFSYFLAALIIDLSFVGMKLVAGIFMSSGLTNIIPNPTETADNSSFFRLFINTIWNDSLWKNIFDPTTNLFTTSFNPVSSLGQPTLLGFLTNFQLEAGKTLVTLIMWLLGAALGLLVVLVILIGLLVQMFRLAWALVNAYINIMAMTVLGPLIILYSSIPGKGGALSFWWKTILANVLIFPAIFATFLFGGIFLANINTADFKQAMPFFAGLPVNFLAAILGYGIILGSPAVPKMLKEAMGVKDLAAFSQEAMKGFGAGASAVGSGAKLGYGKATQSLATTKAALDKRRMEQEAAYYSGGAAPTDPTNISPLKRRLLNWLPLGKS